MHSTIDITEQPETDVLLPVYNCIKYGFDCTDSKTSSGGLASFTVEMAPAETGYDDPGAYILLAGQVINMGTANAYNEVNSAPPTTPAAFAANLKLACEQNSVLFSNFTFTISGGSNEVLLAVSRANKVIESFDFGSFNFTTQVEPNILNANGQAPTYRPNYRLVVQLWVCIGGVFTDLITTENYIPDANGLFNIDVSRKIAPFVSTTPIPIQGSTSAFVFDSTVINQIGVRYGESYSDDLGECNTQLREFASTECITILNAALELDELSKVERAFLTTIPQGQPLCESSPMYLWVNWAYLREQLAPSPNDIDQVDVQYTINYTDGTQDVYPNAAMLAFPVGENANSGLNAVAAGYEDIETFANPSKLVRSWSVQLQVTDTDTVKTEIGNQSFVLQSCCNPSAEFYFLNELGGFDTIIFAQLSQMQIDQTNDTFESFTGCDSTNYFYSGESVNNVQAKRIYSVNSKFVRSYDSEQWIEQFLKSPVKYVSIQTGDRTIIKKVVGLYSSNVVFNQDDNTITLAVQFSDNHLLNVQTR